MKPKDELLPLRGEIVPSRDLKIEKARQFSRLLEEAGEEALARLKDTRRLPALGAEIIVFTLEVERPQVLAHEIRRTETVEAVFMKMTTKRLR